MAQSDVTTEGGQASSEGGQALYEKIANEAMEMSEAGGPSECDSDAIVATIVQKLKVKNPLPEGASEEPLYGMARKMYWDWQDEQRRKKKKSGAEELATLGPETIMEG